MKTQNLVYYMSIAAIVTCAKLAYTQATNDVLTFILKPLSTIVSLVTHSDFVYNNESGYYFKNLNISIDQSCSGINFWIISFTMFSVSILKALKSNLQKLLVIPLLIITTFILTLFANASRILTSITISKQTNLDYPWLHQAEGVLVYVTLLMISYTIFNHIISKFNNNHAKLA